MACRRPSIRGIALLVSLFTFNLGIEIGQLMVLAMMLPAIAW